MSYYLQSTIDRTCIDCGKTIKKGEKYYNDTRKDKKTVYCLKCKKKPEHCRRTLNHEEIILDLAKKPLFKHEFDEKYNMKRSGNSNNIIRRLMQKGYCVNIFRWNRRSRTNSKLGKKEKYNQHFQPNHFIIYYLEGTEDKVVKKLLNAFDYEDVAWKPILQTLYGVPVPNEIVDPKSMIVWANQNVFKYIPNSSQSETKEVVK